MTSLALCITPKEELKAFSWLVAGVFFDLLQYRQYRFAFFPQSFEMLTQDFCARVWLNQS
jgi:hypothetical protein